MYSNIDKKVVNKKIDKNFFLDLLKKKIKLRAHKIILKTMALKLRQMVSMV